MLTDPTFLISMTQDESNYYIGLYIFLAIGALMLIVAFLGCCGAFKESQCLLVSVSSTSKFSYRRKDMQLQCPFLSMKTHFIQEKIL